MGGDIALRRDGRDAGAGSATVGGSIQERVAAAIRPDTKLLLINFPNSPTGASIDALSSRR